MPGIRAVLQLQDPTEFAIAIDELVTKRSDVVGFAALAPAQQTALCIGALEREVNNGGFEQFFSNASGEFAAETVSALENIGATQTAALVRAAIKAVGGVVPKGEDERIDVLDALSDDARERLNDLDAQFANYEEDLASLLRRYVTQYSDQFRD